MFKWLLDLIGPRQSSQSADVVGNNNTIHQTIHNGPVLHFHGSGPFDASYVLGLQVKNKLLECKGQAFEDFFIEVAIAAWETDFEPWRPHGGFGDLKCDGYQPSSKTVFQCYAPERAELPPLMAKIQNDFDGARREFGANMDRWVFVHSFSKGLPAPAGRLINELRTKHNDLTIEVWSPRTVATVIFDLPRHKILRLFPEPFTDGSVQVLAIESAWAAFSGDTAGTPAEAPPIGNPDNDALAALDDMLDGLQGDDRECRRLLLGHAHWQQPAIKMEIIGRVEAHGFAQEVIVQNLGRLAQAGLLKVTENYVLPQDKAICQTAAETLIDEIVGEL